MCIENKKLVNKILKVEAKGILHDLGLLPELFKYLINFDKNQIHKSLSYIEGIILEFYNSGYLRVVISHNNDELYGYAMLFIEPNKSNAAYLHKIYVDEQYRNNGIGTQILDNILDSFSEITLLCRKSKKPFYEKRGFKFIQDFESPDNKNFKLIEGLYSDFSVMSNSIEKSSANIFLLNDRDIMKIINLTQ